MRFEVEDRKLTGEPRAWRATSVLTFTQEQDARDWFAEFVADHEPGWQSRLVRVTQHREVLMTEPEPRMIKVMEDVNQMTVQEVVDFCLQRGLDLETTRLTGGHMQWSRPETEKERARYAVWQAETAQRTENWERATYDRLREKFEGSA